METAETFRCIYCGDRKATAERSLEHLWPRGLGGACAPDFFKTRDVCGRCNNISGLFVDGEFQRSFFMGVETSLASLAFLDITKIAALPCIFTGVFPSRPNDADICERWIGPRGERIFYFHKQDEEDHFVTYAGGDPIQRRRRDPGRVYMTFARANTYWISTAVQSALNTFPRAPLRFVTPTAIPELRAATTSDDAMAERDRNYLEPICRETSSAAQMPVNLDHGKRFQAKLALGFGYALFGPAYAKLAYEQTLRHVFRERDPAKRAEFPFVGSSIFAPPDPDPDMDRLAYEGAFTFLFAANGSGVFLIVFTPNRRRLDMQIAPAGTRLRSPLLEQHHGAFAVLIVPGLQQSVGPIPIGLYGLHQFGTAPHPVLSQLDTRRTPLKDLEAALARYDFDPEL